MGMLLNSFVPTVTAFDPATLFGGTQGGFWDVSDISTLFQDVSGTVPVTAHGDPVARVNDKSGNGNHLLQGTAGARPLYQVSGAQKFVLTDGSDDFLRCGGFISGTTWDRIMALRFISGGATKQIFGGTGANECLFDSGSGGVTMFNASIVGPTQAVSAGTDVVITERWANPSQLAIDNGSYASTPAMAAVNPGGLTIGASWLSLDCTNIRWSGGLMINRALTAPEIASCRTFYGALQGRVL